MATQTTVLDLVKPAGNENALISVINSNMDKVDAEAGKTRGNFAGTYSASSAYAVGDYCIYQGNLYRCTTAIGSGGEAWNSSHWAQVALGNRVRNLENSIASMPTFKTFSVSSSGTTFNLSSNGRFEILFITSSSGACGFATCYTAANGTVYIYKIAGLSNITFDGSTANKLKVSGGTVEMRVIIYAGTFTT